TQAWYTLVPDQAHTALTAGYGSLTGTDSGDYVPTELASDGSFLLVYIPTSRTVTVDLTKLAGTQVHAQWYDPTTGAYTEIGTLAKTANAMFTTPSQAHTDGTQDWLLVIDAVTSGAPVGYWKFDEGSGATTADASGNGATGTLQGGVSWST